MIKLITLCEVAYLCFCCKSIAAWRLQTQLPSDKKGSHPYVTFLFIFSEHLCLCSVDIASWVLWLIPIVWKYVFLLIGISELATISKCVCVCPCSVVDCLLHRVFPRLLLSAAWDLHDPVSGQVGGLILVEAGGNQIRMQFACCVVGTFAFMWGILRRTVEVVVGWGGGRWCIFKRGGFCHFSHGGIASACISLQPKHCLYWTDVFQHALFWVKVLLLLFCGAIWRTGHLGFEGPPGAGGANVNLRGTGMTEPLSLPPEANPCGWQAPCQSVPPVRHLLCHWCHFAWMINPLLIFRRTCGFVIWGQ